MCDACSNTDFSDTRPIPVAMSRLHRRITRRQVGMPFWLAVLVDRAA
jgi:hypothetical protein